MGQKKILEKERDNAIATKTEVKRETDDAEGCEWLNEQQKLQIHHLLNEIDNLKKGKDTHTPLQAQLPTRTLPQLRTTPVNDDITTCTISIDSTNIKSRTHLPNYYFNHDQSTATSSSATTAAGPTGAYAWAAGTARTTWVDWAIRALWAIWVYRAARYAWTARTPGTLGPP